MQKPQFMSWRKSAAHEVNNWDLQSYTAKPQIANGFYDFTATVGGMDTKNLQYENHFWQSTRINDYKGEENILKLLWSFYTSSSPVKIRIAGKCKCHKNDLWRW